MWYNCKCVGRSGFLFASIEPLSVNSDSLRKNRQTRQRLYAFGGNMPTGIYERKPRVTRITFVCEVCGKERTMLPSQVRQRTSRFCSQKCMGEGTRKPERYIELACDQCGKMFTKRVDHLKPKNYCSRDCSRVGRMVPGAKWRDPDQIKNYMREYLNKHRDKHNARSRKWNVENRAIKAQMRINRRSADKRGDFTLEQWEVLKKKYDYRCLCCLKREPEITLQQDHIVPVSRGGITTLENIQPLCKKCNQVKRAKTIDYRSHYHEVMEVEA